MYHSADALAKAAQIISGSQVKECLDKLNMNPSDLALALGNQTCQISGIIKESVACFNLRTIIKDFFVSKGVLNVQN